VAQLPSGREVRHQVTSHHQSKGEQPWGARSIGLKGASQRRRVCSQTTTASRDRGSGIRGGGEVQEKVERTAEKMREYVERAVKKVQNT
jgi:hypothetical protein